MFKRAGLSRRWWRVAAAAGSIAGVLSAAAPAVGAGEPETQTPESLAAMWLTRVALTDLRLVASPKENDYRLTAEMLEIARSLTPREEVLTRLLLEAYENAGNQRRVDELTQEIIRFDPLDAVAQLRLITLRIRQLQSVDDRMAAYDRLLGKDGDSLDPSVRSRLALDAALLAREKGDAAGFTARLSRSIDLDATNKDAATLALTFFTERVSDPVGRLELMLGVLKADPIDYDTHLAIARHLASSGAFTGARRFFGTADSIRAQYGFEEMLDDKIERAIVTWHVDGPRAVINELDRQIADERADYARLIDAAERAQKPTEGMIKPGDVYLNMSLQWLRLLAAHALGDDDLVRPSLEDLLEAARNETTLLSKPDERGPSISDEEAADRTRGLQEETVTARLWTGKELDKAAQGLDVLRGDPKTDPLKLRRMEGLSKLRAGELDAAGSILASLGPDDDVAQLWLCLVEEARSDKAASAAKYREFAKTHMGTLPGAYAWTRAERLAGKPPADPQLRRLEQVAAAVPGWVEVMIGSARKFQTMVVKVEPLEARLMEPARMDVTIRNISPIPLGVGPDRTINSRLLVAPNVQISTTGIRTAEMVQVASMDRRLRLNPREEMKITVWPDAGALGIALDEAFGKPVRVQYRVMQGFELVDAGAGVYMAGPYALSSEAGPVIRPTSVKANADVAAITRWAESGTPREMIEAMVLMRGRELKLGSVGPLTADEQKAVYTAIAKRFDQLSPAWQIAAICVAPTSQQSPKFQPMDEPTVLPLEEAARASTNPEVRKVMIALRVSKPDDLQPYAADPKLAELCQIVRDRLTDGTPCYATFIPRGEKPLPDKGPIATPSEK